MNELILRDAEKEARFLAVVENIPATVGTITSDADYEDVAEVARKLKNVESEVAAYYADAKKKAHEAHKAICDEEASYLKPIKKGIDAIKKAMNDFIQAKEAEKRRQEEELRAAARAEAERLMVEAAEREAKGEDASELIAEALMTESVGNSLTIEAGQTKVDGIAMRKDWQITSVSNAEVPCEIAGVVIRPVDEAAILKLIRATKGTIRIPGIQYTEVNTIAVRR